MSNIRVETQLYSSLELGFEYVTGEYDNVGKLFRKMKMTFLES